MTARPLSDLVEPGWAKALEPVSDQIAAMGEFLRAENAAGRRYLPAGQNVLRAFTFPFDDVRVLIVGQDPYPTPGHAVGLSFSVAPDVLPVPRSRSAAPPKTSVGKFPAPTRVWKHLATPITLRTGMMPSPSPVKTPGAVVVELVTKG